ncbi:MAG: hypothetical protein IVW36_03235 [Dehalococcoidia bacterium]|nr:hypothetical protein [Dehalococcoidia bacterium]
MDQTSSTDTAAAAEGASASLPAPQPIPSPERESQRLRTTAVACALVLLLTIGWLYPSHWGIVPFVGLFLLLLLAVTGGTLAFICGQMVVDEPASEILNVLFGQHLSVRNRSRFINRLQHECDAAAAGRRGRNFSVVVLMLDDVHSEPDRLERLAQMRDLVRERIRSRDVLGDIGKDELWLIAPGAGALAAEALTARLTESLRAAATPGAPPAKVGWSTFGGDADSPLALLDAARARALGDAARPHAA